MGDRTKRGASVSFLLLLVSVSSAPAASQVRVCDDPCDVSAVKDALAVGKAVLEKLNADPTYVPGPEDLPTDVRSYRRKLEDLEVFRCECKLLQVGGRLEAAFFQAQLEDRGVLDDTCTLRNIVAGLRLTRGAVFPRSAQRQLLAPTSVRVKDPKSGRVMVVPGPPDPWRLREALWIVGDVLDQCSRLGRP